MKLNRRLFMGVACGAAVVPASAGTSAAAKMQFVKTIPVSVFRRKYELLPGRKNNADVMQTMPVGAVNSRPWRGYPASTLKVEAVEFHDGDVWVTLLSEESSPRRGDYRYDIQDGSPCDFGEKLLGPEFSVRWNCAARQERVSV